jgi:hypothetical protein
MRLGLQKRCVARQNTLKPLFDSMVAHRLRDGTPRPSGKLGYEKRIDRGFKWMSSQSHKMRKTQLLVFSEKPS